jgi:hypothetical protein
MKKEIIDGSQAETWRGGKIRKGPFFCQVYFSAILPVGLKPESFHLAAVAMAGRTQSNRCSWSGGRANPCKYFAMNDLQLNPSKTQSRSIKPNQTDLRETDRMGGIQLYR